MIDASTPAPATDLPSGWMDKGLSGAALADRLVQGASARRERRASQSWRQILRRNALTRLNFLLVVLGSATLVTGSAPDATFLGIAVINTVVGATQEAKAKRSLDALAVVNAPRARVVRNGEVQAVAPEDVVVDDLLDVRPGDQLTADAMVVDGSGEADESLATGESDPVTKERGDTLVSGSWLVAGSLRARATHVGADSYANRLADQARRFSLTSSELVTGINRVLAWLTWAMVAVAPVLFVRQLQSQPWRLAVRHTVAGLVGMVPEGLVLLTTLAFLAAAVRLGRRQVLVQEMPAVETLARVDALCVDKTGTLTEGRIAFAELHVDGASRRDLERALAGLAGERGANATMTAIREALPSEDGWLPLRRVPFSSARKWSGATFSGHGTWVLGAPEVVTAADPVHLRALANRLADGGSRVLAVGSTLGDLEGGRPHETAVQALPPGLTLVGLVELREQARPAVSSTLAYFTEQGVTVRVISGDSAATVRSLARRVGLPGADLAVDARTLPLNEDEFQEAVEDTRVFGRVTPEQKRAMVHALQDRGHTVAMTGDGVNDVLALKDADLGIAMGAGAAISRGVAKLVVLDNDFDVLPSVVAEGRRVLANIERTAVLFLVKNVYSLVLSVAVSITGWPYPFLPRHLTLISSIGIGIPGFFLALAPNERRFRPGFLRRALSLSAMAGCVAAAAVLGGYAVGRAEGLAGDTSRTTAILVATVVTLWVLVIAARPVNAWRGMLVVAMAGVFAAAYLTPGVDAFFSLDHRPGLPMTLEALAFGAAGAAAIDLLQRWPPMRRITGIG